MQQYIYIDRLLDSSLPHNLLNDYNNSHSSSGTSANLEVPHTISEESSCQSSNTPPGSTGVNSQYMRKIKRTPKDLYRVPTEDTPLVSLDEDYDGPKPEIPGMEDDSVESGDRIVQVAIYINLAANTILLAGKIAVIVLTSSLSVLASLVDAALDFLSTGKQSVCSGKGCADTSSHCMDYKSPHLETRSVQISGWTPAARTNWCPCVLGNHVCRCSLISYGSSALNHCVDCFLPSCPAVF